MACVPYDVVNAAEAAGLRARLEASEDMDPRRLAGFADYGYLFREQVVLSGVVPQVAAMLDRGALVTRWVGRVASSTTATISHATATQAWSLPSNAMTPRSASAT